MAKTPILTKDGLKKYDNNIKDYINAAIDRVEISGAVTLMGTLGTDGDITELPPTYKKGEMYQVVTEGEYAGKKCEVGDFVVAVRDNRVTIVGLPEVIYNDFNNHILYQIYNPITDEYDNTIYYVATWESPYNVYGYKNKDEQYKILAFTSCVKYKTENNGITWDVVSVNTLEGLTERESETVNYKVLYTTYPIYNADGTGVIAIPANPYNGDSMDAFNADWAVIQGNIEDLVSEGAIYIDPEEETPDIGDIEDVTSAKFVSYNNTDSNLEATNVQEAIDEIKELVSDSSVPEGTAYIDFNESSTDIPGSAENVTSATLVSYDNSTSGLEASNVQEAVDKVSFRTEWKLQGHFAGKGHIAPLPTSFDELYIAITDSYSSRTFTVNVLRHHIETMIDEYNIEYLATFGFATSLDSQTGWYAGGCLKITKTTINLLDYSFRGTDHSDDVKWLVYCR